MKLAQSLYFPCFHAHSTRRVELCPSTNWGNSAPSSYPIIPHGACDTPSPQARVRHFCLIQARPAKEILAQKAFRKTNASVFQVKIIESSKKTAVFATTAIPRAFVFLSKSFRAQYDNAKRAHSRIALAPPPQAYARSTARHSLRKARIAHGNRANPSPYCPRQ